MPKGKPIVARTIDELADALGLTPADGAEIEFRVELNEAIIDVVKKTKITHAHLARLAGTSRPRVTNLLNRNSGDISTDLMLRVLASMGYRVHFKVSKAA